MALAAGLLAFLHPGRAVAGFGLAYLPPGVVELGETTPSANPTEIPVTGPWRLVGVTGGVRSYEAPLPVRLRSLFFGSAPEGMSVRRGKLKFNYGNDLGDRDRAQTWAVSARSLTVRIRADAGPPGEHDFQVAWPVANEREAAFFYDKATKPERFVTRNAQVDATTRQGIYLPAPGRVSWRLELPPGAVFRSSPGIVPPEVADGTVSDGTGLELWVDGTRVAETRVPPSGFIDWKADLSAWAGLRHVELRSADTQPLRDHLLVGAPSIYVPSPEPRKVVLVFIDTLRRDHVGVYGNPRDATPAIDRFATANVIFEDARTIAPWTLPSTRTVLTGKQPERWSTAESLARRLGALGWATGAIVGNIYLSSNFEMSKDWGEHRCINLPLAEVESDGAIDFLSRHADQDSLLMVHYMDAHLPYKEPFSYRGMFVEEDLPELPAEFNRNTLLRAKKYDRKQQARYLKARYDQNLRYIDDQVARVLARLPDDAIVVIFADHGEEFYDHDDLEHGHSLHDELLRIPLIMRLPGAAPRRVNAPVSLLDVAPTLLAALGLPFDGLDGESLLELARDGDTASFTGRARAFGRPLYGEESWGSLIGDQKLVTRKGVERVFDLANDPLEANDLRATADIEKSREALGEGVSGAAVTALRLTVNDVASKDLGVLLEVPAGVHAVWAGGDPFSRSSATVACRDLLPPDAGATLAGLGPERACDGRSGPTAVQIRFTGQRGYQREVYVALAGDPVEGARGATLRIENDPARSAGLSGAEPDGSGATLAELKTNKGVPVRVTWATVPLPIGGEIEGFNPEVAGALEALGYTEREPESGAQREE